MTKPVTYKVFFDTTTLCAAIHSPTGLNMQLLEMARIGLVEPVFSQEVIAEWVRNCREGLGEVVYDDDDIEAFCKLLEPLLSADQIIRVELGRCMGPLHPVTQAAGVTIIQSPHNRPQTFAVNATTLALKDIHDSHVVAAALKEGCDYLCSGNTKDLPDGHKVQNLEFITPKRLHALLASQP